VDELLNTTLEGQWWQPELPHSVLHGTLKFNDRFHGDLKLKGPQRQFKDMLARMMRGERWTLYGLLSIGHKFEVSFFNVGMIRGPSMGRNDNEQTEATFFTNEILIGAHVPDTATCIVNGASLVLSGLARWCDDTSLSLEFKDRSISGDEEIVASFRGTKSDPVMLDANYSIRTVSAYQGPQMAFNPKSLALRERNSFNLVFAESVSIVRLLREIAVWQALLVLSTRRPAYMEEIRLSIGEMKGFPYQLIMPGRRHRDEPGEIYSHDYVLTKAKLGKRFPAFMTAWRSIFEKIEIPAMLFNNFAYQEGAHLHTRLLYNLQALEILHREIYGGCRFPDKKTWKATLRALKRTVRDLLPGNLGDEVSEGLNFVGSLTLLDRLRDLYDKYPKSVGALFKSRDTDMALLKDARNFLTHYGSQKKFNRDFLMSRQLYVLSEKSRLFVEICLLGSAGLSDDDIRELFKTFEPYNEATWHND
jgi:hypothetical protein